MSSTIANFYKGLEQVYTQEAVYSQVTMLPGCESVTAYSLPPGPPCNQSGYPPIPMRVLNVLGTEFQGRPKVVNTQDPILGELLNSRPVVVGLAVQGGRTQYSHAVVLDAGFRFNGQDYWNICDPTAGISMVSVYTFPTGFPDRLDKACQWLETWFTVNPN